MNSQRGLLTGALIGVCALIVIGTGAQMPPDVVRKGKLATALVEVANGSVYGSAFAIRASGLFVTNAHVVSPEGEGAGCSLIVHPGESDQKKVHAHVARIDKELDLALLQVDGPITVPTLELGDSDSLAETQEVAAFGFPFGKELAAGVGEYPGVTVTVGRITSLRRVKGGLAAVQVDAGVHPGNSGGPLVSARGQVVGIVAWKFREAEGINFAIPVNSLRYLLEKTEIQFTPPAIAAAAQHQKQEFVVRVTTFAPTPEPFQVELILTTEGMPPRTYAAQTTDGRAFHVSAVPLPAQEASSATPIRLTIQTDGSEVRARVKDRTFRADGRIIKLGEVREIQLGPNPRVTLNNGDTIGGEIVGLGDVEAEVAGTRVPIHLSRANRILVDNLSGIVPTVAYHVVVRRQKAVVAESNGALVLGTNTAAVPSTPHPLQGSAAFRFEEAHSYKVPAAVAGVVVADLDGDHIPDVVVGGAKDVGVLYGRPDGTLEPFQSLLTWEAGVGSRQLVDMNGDGRPDLVFLDGLGKLVILYNKGGRRFSEPEFQTIESNGTLFVGDLNRDGRPDIVVGIWGDGGSGTVRVLLNTGNGTFHKQTEFRHIGIIEGVTAKDINGDGIPDLAVSYETSTVGQSGVSIYYGDGKGGFNAGPGYNIGTMNMTSPIFADLNGDGKPDLMVCNYWGGNVAVFLNKGDGTFLPPTRYPAHAYPMIIAIADLNGDGRPDFAVASAGTSSVSVYRNRGNGQFEDPAILDVGGVNCRSVAIADFNRDGKPDLVVQCENSASVSVLINRTTGN